MLVTAVDEVIYGTCLLRACQQTLYSLIEYRNILSVCDTDLLPCGILGIISGQLHCSCPLDGILAQFRKDRHR